MEKSTNEDFKDESMTTPKFFNQGIYTDMSIEDYHAANGISKSAMTDILDCPAKYFYNYFVDTHRTTSPALSLGSLVHTLTLEPEKFDDEYLVMPKVDGRTKDGKALKAEMELILAQKPSLALVSTDIVEQARMMASSMHNNSIFNGLFNREEPAHVEHSFFLDDCGVMLKSRPDFYCGNVIFDLKTCEDANPKVCSKKIFDYGYHMQAALALNVVSNLLNKEMEYFVFGFIEKEPPYLCAFYQLTTEALQLGERQIEKAVSIYRECIKTKEWPAFDDEIKLVDIPAWAYKYE